MTDKEHLNSLRLIRTPQIGPITYSLLIARYGSASDAVKAAPQLAKRQGRPLKIADIASCEAIIKQCQSSGATMLVKYQAGYPERLNVFDDAPAILFAKGHLSLFNRDMLAIVGARNASVNAMTLASKWADEIGQAGYVIISGLARGIDRAAHIGALRHGTIGVLGSGVDVIYPEQNADIFEEMVNQGLIITEMMPGTKPSPRNFPARNRIIASLAKSTLVIEAAKQSGSLITARDTAERGGDVMAVPGTPLDPRAAGGNDLIKQGAHLVTSPQDVLDILRTPLRESTHPKTIIQRQNMTQIDDELITKLANEIMKMITIEAVDIDELTRQCHVNAQMIQIALLELELAGHVLRLSGNRVCKNLNYE